MCTFHIRNTNIAQLPNNTKDDNYRRIEGKQRRESGSPKEEKKKVELMFLKSKKLQLDLLLPHNVSFYFFLPT